MLIYLYKQMVKEYCVMEEKIYGLYPAGLNEKQIQNAKEYELYFWINQLGGQLFWIRHEWADGRLDISYEDAKKEETLLEYRIEYLVYQLKKFGVKFESEPKVGEHIKKDNETYWKWFKFWNSHFEKMPHEEFKKFQFAHDNGQDLSDYLPKTKWNEDESSGANEGSK